MVKVAGDAASLEVRDEVPVRLGRLYHNGGINVPRYTVKFHGGFLEGAVESAGNADSRKRSVETVAYPVSGHP
jgi:hypothetical protein